MSEKISFIHCADLHIDSPFKGLSNISPDLFKDIIESTFQSLENLVDVAISKDVDFILMVGDLFDSDRQSIKAQSRLKTAFERLNQHDIEVFVSYGNHDHVKGRLFEYDYPNNVHVFTNEEISSFTYSKQGTPMATIYGFSYENRAVDSNKAVAYHKTGDTPYHIGMLHGSLSNNTDHDVYAPFQLSDLTDKGFDYWALGHIHKRQQLKESPPIIYPGNIQGRSRKESGEKGCYYVELNKQSCSLEFCPLQAIRFEEIKVDTTGCEKPQDLETLVEQVTAKKRETVGRCILNVTFLSESNQLQEWHRAGYLTEIIDFINEVYQNESNWAFIQDFKLDNKVNWDKQQLKKGQHFLGELVRGFDETDNIDSYVEPLVYHRQARKFLEHFSDEEKNEIINQAEKLLVNQLLAE